MKRDKSPKEKAKRGRPPKEKPKTVDAPKGLPTCPSYLGAEGKAEWKRVTKQLTEMGTLALIDRAVLSAYCEAWEEFVTLVKQVRGEGITISTTLGNSIQNPNVGAKNKAAERLIKIAAQFGMTPLARTKIEVAEKPASDDFGNFIKPNFRKKHG